jgi:ATP-dependent DNA ligase
MTFIRGVRRPGARRAGRARAAVPKRRKRLRQLLDDVGAQLALMPATRELGGAQAWLHDHVAAGVEGVVVKHRQHGYRPRRRSWWKVRASSTADAIVGGVTGSLDAPEALLLGLPDEQGRLRVAGRTGALPLPARRELGRLLVPPQGKHPWPERISSSRFGQLSPRPVSYTPATRSSSSRSMPTLASSTSAGGTPPRSAGYAATWNPPTWPD